jgi:hypothetical protein
MSVSLAHVWQQFVESASLLRRRHVRIGIVIATVTIVLSVVLAPNVEPTGWDWGRIATIGILGGGAALMFASARLMKADDPNQRVRLVIAAALIGLALLLNLTFTLGTALVFSIGFTALALVASSDSPWRTTRSIAGTLIATIPFWVWSALQAWTAGLLLLVPLALIGVVSGGHMRAATGFGGSTSPLSQRAHRLASWLGVLGSALVALVAGLVGSASDGVVALGAVGAMVLFALDAGTQAAPASSLRKSVAIADVSLLWVALCWIVSL